MKRVGIGLAMAGLVLSASGCSDDPSSPTPGGSSGSGGGSTAAAGGGAGGSNPNPGGGAGASTAGSSGSGSGGMSSNTGGVGGTSSAGAGGSVSGGGSGGSSGAGGTGGGSACDTNLGKAIQFAEKTKDLVAGDLGADATLGDKDRTLELWAKFTSAKSWTAEQSIIELGKPGQPDNGNNVFGIDMSGRKGAGGVFGPYTHGVSDNNGTGAPPFLDNTPADVGWLHLSWAYQQSTHKLEFAVNGNVLPTEFNQAKFDATGGKLVGNTGYVLLGASQNFGNDGWDGIMDEVRIWSTYRTPQEIAASMKVIVKPDTPGLIAYYQFNEGDAANIADSTKKPAHKLAACTAAGGACPAVNATAPSTDGSSHMCSVRGTGTAVGPSAEMTRCSRAMSWAVASTAPVGGRRRITASPSLPSSGDTT